MLEPLFAKNGPRDRGPSPSYPAAIASPPETAETSARIALVRSLLAGITAGVLAGSTLGVAFVFANRYLADGQPQLALASLRDFLNRYALRVALFFVGIELTYLVLADGLGRRWRRLRAAPGLNAALWILVITGVALWGLRFAPWTPHVLSPRGILLFGGVALAGAIACRLALRHGERLRSAVGAALRGLGGAKPAGTALVLLAGVNAGAAVLASHEPRTGPNILLITIDALRADHLGAYGYPRQTSPNIDRLAGEGVRFQRAVSQWPLTSPSFAAMMSSTYGHTNGLMRTTAQRMPDRALMLAELLRAGGYDTWAAVGNVNLARAFNFDQGFEIYRELWREDDQRRTELTTRSGLELLDRASNGRPFFLWLHYFDPHARYQPPKPFDGMFVNDAHFDASWRVPLLTQKRWDIGGISSNVNLGREDRVAYYIAQYDAEIRSVDSQVGILMQALKARGLDGRTLVVVTADHGESLGDHNYFFEHGRFPYDDCVHVPLIFHGPGVAKAGEVVRSPVELIDLAPTLLDLAGLPPNPEAEGKSLRRLLDGERAGDPRWQYAFTESGFAQNYQRSITSERYKLVFVPDAGDRRVMQGRELELYDLQEDPGETKNLIDERPQVAAPLERRLQQWIVEGGGGAGIPTAARIDSQAEEQLRSLGYIQ
jgi:arylsulfatase A-like enzyme